MTAAIAPKRKASFGDLVFFNLTRFFALFTLLILGAIVA